MLPQRRWRWTCFEYSRGVGRVYDSEQPLCLLLLALKIKLLSRANYEAFVLKVPPEWRCRRWIGFEHCRCPRSCVWQWAGICSRLHWQLHYYSRINHETFLSRTATVPEIILKWVKKKCILTLYILPLSHFPVFTTFSNAFILADENSHSRWQTEPASCIFIYFVIPETISTCLLVFK